MTPQDVVHAAESRGIRLSIHGDKLHVEPAGALDDDLKAALVAHKPQILRLLHRCSACKHFSAALPTGTSNDGIVAAGWCRWYQVTCHPTAGFGPLGCDNYASKP